MKTKSFGARHIAVAAVALSAAASAMAAGPLVDSPWVQSNIGQANIVLIDLRKPEDYAAGHIPGAVNATYGAFGWREEVDGVVGQLPPLATLNERIGSLGITPDTQVVVVPYGKTSSDVGSGTRVYWTFRLLGHSKVALLDGGFRNWQDSGFATQTGAVTPGFADSYPGQVDEQLIIDTVALVDSIESGSVVPIDARPDDQYNGEAKHPKARIAGAIPDSKRLPQADLIDPDTGKFRTRAEILAVAEAHDWDLGTDKPLVSYCNTGHWASVAWFALSEIAERDNVTLYDGSMVAWTQDSDRPLINSPSRFEQLVDKLIN